MTISTRGSSQNAKCKMLSGGKVSVMHNLKNVNFHAKECSSDRKDAGLPKGEKRERERDNVKREERCTSLN